MDFAVPARHRVKITENEKKDKYQDLADELEKYGTWSWRWYQFSLVHLEQRIGIGTGRLVNKRTSRYHSNDSISGIGQNTEKSPEDLRRLVVTQTPVKKTSANTSVGKISKGCSEYDTKLLLRVRLQFCREGMCGIHLYCHYSQVHSDRDW